jgi:DNA repair exonuclease SbcCD ATPase subunit
MQRQQIEFTVQNEVKAGSASRKAEIAEQEGALKVKNAERQTLLNEWQAYNNRKTAIIAEQDKLRNDYALENAKVLVFDDKDFCCPTCKRTYDAGDVDVRKAEMEKNFNQAKSTALNNINTKGSSLGQELKDINVKLENIEAKGTVVKNEMEVLENRIKELKELNERLLQDESGQYEKALAANKEYLSLSAQIEALTAEIDKPYEQEDNTALKLRKQDMSKQLDELKNKLATKGQREKQLERIAELEGQETTMAQELASLEGQEYTIEQFTKAKMDEVEKRVNGRFKIVRFKLFEEQINGALAEACTTLINGVPYADANTASKIQAGLDIINTLTAHYEVQAPVWVDNRESIVTLPETDCQLINLIVSGKDKKLRIEAMQEAAVA